MILAAAAIPLAVVAIGALRALMGRRLFVPAQGSGQWAGKWASPDATMAMPTIPISPLDR